MSNYHTLRTKQLFSRPVDRPDLGSNQASYGNLFLKNKIFINNSEINSNTLLVPRITSITYGVGRDTADPAGNETLILHGTGFNNNATVLIDKTEVELTTYVSSTQLTFLTPTKLAGTYSLFVINPDGSTGASATGITYS